MVEFRWFHRRAGHAKGESSKILGLSSIMTGKILSKWPWTIPISTVDSNVMLEPELWIGVKAGPMDWIGWDELRLEMELGYENW